MNLKRIILNESSQTQVYAYDSIYMKFTDNQN